MKKKKRSVKVPSVDWGKAIKKAIMQGKKEDLARIYYHLHTAVILLDAFLPKKRKK